MKPVMQTRFGAEGNCWPACLASLFEVPLEEVDWLSCQDHPAWIKKTQDYLAKRGLFFVEIPTKDRTPPIPEGALVILGCNTHRKLPHVVIGRAQHTEHHEDGQLKRLEWHLVHDPHPDAAIETVDSVFLLCKLDPFTIT